MGMLQSTVNCGFVLITAKWCKYKSILSDFMKPQLTQLHSIDTKYEHAGRVGIWAASAGFSSMEEELWRMAALVALQPQA